MPLQPNNLHTANDPSLKESSGDQAETIPAPEDYQGTAGHNTSSSDNSDSDNSKTSKPLLDLNDINKMNINTLHNMLTQSTLYTPKLTTKNWYTWNPHFQDILITWSLAPKHLDGITKPGDRKYDRRLDAKLCTILQSNAKLIGQDNVNYLCMQPANAEAW
ncbi:uncharacterized protein UHO2_00411 [Ustilago hordei]|uniref:uncharacterized protein n=1 Tax=Ustilago hordei TaxID=120017 RepID=UPI001A50A22F|nr:uncharacterized protein UHO2_00411 [Ustilago hordei]SYW81912.1 uncharacterized protein UHO2_00411 [Ustilago hordei]